MLLQCPQLFSMFKGSQRLHVFSNRGGVGRGGGVLPAITTLSPSYSDRQITNRTALLPGVLTIYRTHLVENFMHKN